MKNIVSFKKMAEKLNLKKNFLIRPLELRKYKKVLKFKKMSGNIFKYNKPLNLKKLERNLYQKQKRRKTNRIKKMAGKIVKFN